MKNEIYFLILWELDCADNRMDFGILHCTLVVPIFELRDAALRLDI